MNRLFNSKDEEDLVLQFSDEVEYMRRNKTNAKGEKLKRCGGSYNPRFQWSAMLLGSKPDNLAKAHQVLQKATALLRQCEQFDYDVADQAFNILKTIPGFDGTKAQQTLQFAARFSLVPNFFCEYASVDCSNSCKSGPSLVLRNTCHCSSTSCICEVKIRKDRFRKITEELQAQRVGRDLTYLTVKNGLCMVWRIQHEGRAVELIFFDEYKSMKSVQNFFVYNSNKTRKTGRYGHIIFRHQSKWRRLNELVLLDLSPQNIKYPNQNGCIRFLMETYPQSSWV